MWLIEIKEDGKIKIVPWHSILHKIIDFMALTK